MAIRTEFFREEEAVAELSTAVLKGVLFGIDVNGEKVVVPKLSLFAITGTLYDLATGTILNSFDDVDLLTDARATIDASGNITVILKPADSPIVTPTSEVALRPRQRVPGEQHLLLIEFSWDGGNKAAAHEWVFQVLNLNKRG